MERDRELFKAVCVAVVRHMQGHPEWVEDELTVDTKRLRSWLLANTGMSTDAEVLDSAMGYNNFCMDVVSATRPSR